MHKMITFRQFREANVPKEKPFPTQIVLRRVAIRKFPSGRNLAGYRDRTSNTMFSVPQFFND